MGIKAAPGSEEEKTGVVEGREETLGEAFDWKHQFRKDSLSMLNSWASQFGYDKFVMESFVRDNIDRATNYMWERHADRQLNIPEGDRSTDAIDMREYQRMWHDGMGWFTRESGLDFDGLGQTGRSGSGSGSRRPTASDIRNMFDEDELTEAAHKMWGAYLVEDNPEARNIAREYINAIVASGGEQELDFQTFVLNKIRGDARHNMLYRNKPEGMDELQYITPYTQAAATVIGGAGRPGATANDVAAGGAALGATSDAFRDRLARTPQHQQTKGFINGLEQRVRDVKNVLRG